MLKTYRLPTRFVWDHWSRDLPETGRSERVRENRSYVWANLDADAYDDLLSDARHYSQCASSFDPNLRGLVRSATATVAALEAEGRP